MKSWLRQILAVLLLAVVLVLLFRISPVLVNKELLSTDDFVEYWAAGRLNLRGGNPYSPEQLEALQLHTGRTFQVPVRMWNLPSILPLIMPFGAFDFPFSRVLWFLTHLALICFCASYIWRLYGGSPNLAWVPLLLAFSFLPTLFMLKVGQIGTFMLFGVVLFLMFTQRRAWWLAGLAMLFMANKPHVLYLVPLAFLLWTINQRRWALLAGSATGIILAIGIALLFNPQVLRQYLDFIGHNPPNGITPTIGGVLRYYSGPEKMWLQILPAALGAIWFMFYWFKRRRAWDWSEQMPLMLTVSVLTASYGWTYDYVVLIPVIVAVAVRLVQRGLDATTLVAIMLYAAIDGAVLVTNLNGMILEDFWLMWLAPAFAGWYFLVVRLGMFRLPAGTARS
jgi:hypothetical protein